MALPTRTIARAAALHACLAGTSFAAGTLYDATLGTLPTAQSWQYQANPNDGPATQQVAASTLTLDTTAARADRAGYPSRLPTVSPLPPFPNHPLIGTLDRIAGFTVRIDLRIDAEGHNTRDDNGDSLDDRAGFSILIVASDLQAIELAFFEDRIWAQDDDFDGPLELFTQAEGVTFDTTAAERIYEVSIVGDIYRLFADGSPILGGRLRDYTAAAGLAGLVYKTQDQIFWGDNTGSADSRSEVSLVALTNAPIAGPTCPGDIDWSGTTDVFDFSTFAAHFGDPVPLGTLGDLDLNSFVDAFDFSIFAGSFGCTE